MAAYRDIAFGALAGLSATMAMTTAMRLMHRSLPAAERYPLPPREITEAAFPAASEADGPATALLAHFAYSALTGALYACLPRGRPPGVLYGPAVWAASYFGWIPTTGILRPAGSHPARRNALMILAHAVWGGALSHGLGELQAAARQGFAGGRLADAPREVRRKVAARGRADG